MAYILKRRYRNGADGLSRKANIIEVVCIVACAFAVWLAEPWFPRGLPLGEIILYGSALLLFQGLVRDLYLKYVAPKPVACDVASKGKCLCMESAIGGLGVLTGITILVATGVQRVVQLPQWAWPVCVLVIGATGIMVREY
jgi:hypothetical protein